MRGRTKPHKKFQATFLSKIGTESYRSGDPVCFAWNNRRKPVAQGRPAQIRKTLDENEGCVLSKVVVFTTAVLMDSRNSSKQDLMPSVRAKAYFVGPGVGSGIENRESIGTRTGFPILP